MNILDSNNKVERVSSNLISFSDCPNNCVDGKIFNPYTHKKEICTYCAEKREKFAKDDIKDSKTGKTISELLELPVSYTGNEFNEDLVLPEFAKKDMTPESVSSVLSKLRELITDISIGILPKCSLMFNLGKKANEINFIYPYLIKGYILGLSLVPLITLTDLCQLRLAFEGSTYSVNLNKDYNYNDLINRDICIVVIDAGATYTSLLAVKGLVQLRAQKLKPTIIFTNQWNNYVRDICSEDDYECYNLATLYSVEYKNSSKEQGEKTKSESINNQMSPTAQSNGFGVSSNTLRNMMTAKNSL